MAEPEAFGGAMRVSLSVTKLVMVSMCAYPINWVPLKCQNPTIGKGIFKPFGKLETPMRKVPVERKSDAKKASDNIESHSHPKCRPIEMEWSKEAKHMHCQHNPSSANIQRAPFSPKENTSLSLHLNFRQQNLSVFQ
ncbi:hypothetical protein V8G54_004765 [Vigna mungo]|uniref:Uncharacterized protein n=1 Tax=Vigna mungo TaxID=3915 RepID=A0AAQ3SFN1_VIGMU